MQISVFKCREKILLDLVFILATSRQWVLHNFESRTATNDQNQHLEPTLLLQYENVQSPLCCSACIFLVNELDHLFVINYFVISSKNVPVKSNSRRIFSSVLVNGQWKKISKSVCDCAMEIYPTVAQW